MKINNEVKTRRDDAGNAIQLYIQLIFMISGRNYSRKIIPSVNSGDSGAFLFTRFLKLVSEYFLSMQKVSDYARVLHVSSDHLNRTIRYHSHKTAHEFINEMILKEAQAYLLHSQLSIAEVAYQLGFSDPSHFNKFFKRLSGNTPLQYRKSK
jgi:AraC-like DNA-binding protein